MSTPRSFWMASGGGGDGKEQSSRRTRSPSAAPPGVHPARNDHPAGNACGRQRPFVSRNAVPHVFRVQPPASVPRGVRACDVAHRATVHRPDRHGVPAGQRRRVGPRSVGSHADGGDPRHHRGRPPDQQGPPDQVGQPARRPQRAGPAVVRRAKPPSVPSIHCCARSTTCCSRTYRARTSQWLPNFYAPSH